MEDRAIIALYQTRNEQAIRETDAKYGKLCYQIAYNILSRHEDSEECVNDTYVGAWNAIPPAKPTHFRAFLCKITRNLSLKRLAYLRQEKRNQDMAVSLSDLEAILPDDRYAPGLTDADVGRAIESFLWLQKPEVRCVFVRRYYCPLLSQRASLILTAVAESAYPAARPPGWRGSDQNPPP